MEKEDIAKKGRIGTVTDATEDADIKAPKLMEFIEVTDLSVAKAGERIQFVHDATEGEEGLVYWLEGRIQRRIAKLSRAQIYRKLLQCPRTQSDQYVGGVNKASP